MFHRTTHLIFCIRVSIHTFFSADTYIIRRLLVLLPAVESEGAVPEMVQKAISLFLSRYSTSCFFSVLNEELKMRRTIGHGKFCIFLFTQMNILVKITTRERSFWESRNSSFKLIVLENM